MKRLNEKRLIIDEWLDKMLPAEDERPSSIHKAMRHSVFAGGKRLRPVLAIMAYEFCGGNDPETIYPSACALEMIHTYTLIHDDLPAMDDDDLRRGKPTCHKIFGDAIAILAGDALHALAFEYLVTGGSLQLIKEVARTIGTNGLVGGQVVDIESEGKEITPEELIYIHKNKTAALLLMSVRMGAILAGAPKDMLDAISIYGENLGLAFQIIDDILDIKGTEEELGKPIGSDEELNKATYPRIFGLDKSYEEAKRLLEEAKDALAPYPNNDFFTTIADFIYTRAY